MLDAGGTAGAPVAAAEHQTAGEGEEGREEADVKRVSSSSRSIDAADAAAGNDAPSRLRALFCTLEFSSDTFSGNGTLAQACVRGLASAGVDVVCLAARPQSVNDDGGGKVSPSSRDRLHGASELVEVPVPRALWGRLDARSPWREFRDGAAAAMAPELPDLSSSFDVVLAVDWTGVAAAEALLQAAAAAAAGTGEESKNKKRPPPIIYLNFRVFARSAETPLERELVLRAEGRAVAVAAEASVALCAADAADLLLLAQEEQEQEEKGEGRGGPPPAMTVLLPPLRREFAEMPPPPPEEEGEEEEGGGGEEGEEGPPAAATAAASCEGGGKENVDSNGARQQQQQQQQQRRLRRSKRNLLLCCVRLSPEKEPHRFVEVVEALASLGVLKELNIVPALVGGGDGEYARGLRERMLRLRGGGGKGGGEEGGKEGEVFEEAIVEGGFVGAAELAARFFDRAALNFHPCLADAYGMSAVEAGSRGAPSVIHQGEEEGEKATVGASALLRAGRGESLALDLSAPAAEVAGQVAALLRGDRGAGAKAKAASELGSSSVLSLREVGERAQRRARSWGEREHGAALAALARRVVVASSSSSSPSGEEKL